MQETIRSKSHSLGSSRTFFEDPRRLHVLEKCSVIRSGGGRKTSRDFPTQGYILTNTEYRSSSLTMSSRNLQLAVTREMYTHDARGNRSNTTRRATHVHATTARDCERLQGTATRVRGDETTGELVGELNDAPCAPPTRPLAQDSAALGRARSPPLRPGGASSVSVTSHN